MSLRWAAVGLTTLVANTATAEPDLPVDVTSSLSAGWHTGDADHYGDLFGRLNVASVFDAWSAALRLDTATFASAPSDEVDGRYTLEKATASWTGREVEVSVGDAYVSFGRGLALTLRKLDELGVDTTLRGAKALLHHGDLSGTLTAGYVNINNVDEATGLSVDDPYDLAGGVQGQVLVADKVHVGGYGTAVVFHDALGLVPTDTYTDRMLQYGVTLDAPRLTDHVGVYLEATGQDVSTEPDADHPHGFGLYGTATGYFGRTTVLFEGKAYGALTPVKPRFDTPAFAAVAYNSPPTVERVLQVIENPSREIAGGRVRGDVRLSAALLVYANYGLFRDWEGYANPALAGDLRPGTIHDPYAGVESRWDQGRSWATVSGGWRAVVLDGTRALVRGDGHLELDVAQSLGPTLSLTLHGVLEERKKHASELLDERWREGTLLAGFHLASGLSVAGGYDYTTEVTQPQTHYFNGNLGWDLTSSSSVRLFAGAARGGLRCVSGVCRNVPPFEGVKVNATVRF